MLDQVASRAQSQQTLMLSCEKTGETKPSFTECPFVDSVGREAPLPVGQEIGGRELLFHMVFNRIG